MWGMVRLGFVRSGTAGLGMARQGRAGRGKVCFNKGNIMSDDSFWVERAQSAEARLATLKQSLEPALERVRNFKANFGIRERDDGSIDIDYDKFIENLGAENALILKSLIQKKYG